jgi:hypothetical protein
MAGHLVGRRRLLRRAVWPRRVLLWHISKTQDRLDTAVAKVTESVVTQKEVEWRTARGAEDRQRTDAAVNDLREGMVPREELDRIFASQEQWRQNLRDGLDRIEQDVRSVVNHKHAAEDCPASSSPR